MNYPGVSESITTKEQADKFIDDAVSRKCDFIKMYETIDSSLYFYFMGRAKDKNISVIGHTPRNVNPVRMLQAGQKMIAHGEELFFDFFDCRECGIQKKPDESRIPGLVSLLKHHGTFVTANLSFIKATKQALENFNSFESDPEYKYLSPGIRQVWKNNDPNKRQNLEQFKEREKVKYEFVKKLTGSLNDAGVQLLTGTDCCLPGLFPGKSMLLDIAELKSAGLSNYDCLAAATRNPGQFIYHYAATGKDERFGQVSVGFRADLLLLDKNPLESLENLSSISAVILRGKYYDTSYLGSRRNVY